MRPVEGVNKFNREEWQVQLTPLLNLWKKLNQVCNASSTTFYCPVLKLYQVNWSEQSTFLFDQICYWNMFSKPFVFWKKFIDFTCTTFWYRKFICYSGFISCRIISYKFKLALKNFLVAGSFYSCNEYFECNLRSDLNTYYVLPQYDSKIKKY